VSNRVVLVTGGSRGIGLACARAFQALGDNVAVTYRKCPVDDVYSVQCDVTSASQVNDAFAAIEEHWGPVEVLVSNAGITSDRLLLQMDDEDIIGVLDANLVGAFRVARRAIRRMVRARQGRIIFVSSVAGLLGSPGQTNYAASKAGLVGLARSLAREVAQRFITVNVVAPGPINTDMTAALSAQLKESMAALIPAKRFGEAQEVAAAVTFLASPDAAYVTGAVIPVDGGLGMGH
jgi:beta-ketoacyl ACP reductase